MKPRTILAILVLAAVAATAPVAHAGPPRTGCAPAQEAEEPQERQRVEERVVVTADRLDTPLDAVGSAVTVLDEQAIRASGARWMPELLAGLPGVAIAANGGPGAVASVFLRGTNSNHTLVLVDGVKINSPTTGAVDLSKLATANIERVEIVRGPQGALYGSQALGGVIQVFTRRPRGRLQASLGAGAGAFSTHTGRAWVGAAGDSFEWAAGAAAFASDGISAAASEGGATEPDGYDSLTADARFGSRLSERLRLDAFGRTFDADNDIDGFAFPAGPVDDLNAVSESRELYAGGRALYEAGGLRSTLTVGDTEQWSEARDPDASFTLASELRASIRELDWQNELSRGEHLLLGGAELRREAGRIGSTTIFGDSGFDESIRTAGVYLHDRASLGDRVHLMAGGRWEHHTRYGDNLTFRASAAAMLGSGLSLHASVGSGFRAPSLNDLYFPVFSNPDLEPERSLGVDAGLRWSPAMEGVRVDVTAFHIDIEDLVFFSGSRPENLGEVRTRGVEATLGWRSTDAELTAAYTFTDAVDRQTDLALIRRPRDSASLRAVVYPRESLSLFSELRLIGSRDDLAVTGRVTLDSYVLWNAAASFELTPDVAVRARLDNLLDTDYEEVFGYGTPGRSAHVGLELKLR